MASDGWISVAERLPTGHEPCVAVFRDAPHVARRSMAAPDTWYIPDLKVWDSGATYWMALPEPPAEPARPGAKARGKKKGAGE